MNALKRITLWLAFFAACFLPASALTPTAPENRIWEISSIGYDAAPTEATDLGSRTETSTGDYDSAPIYSAATKKIPTEANRTLSSQNAEFKAADGGGGIVSAGGGGGPLTIGDIIGDAHPDSMIHLTVASPEELNATGGVYANSIFVKYGDVAHMTLPEYQELVVQPHAWGYGNDVKGFVVSNPGAAEFTPHWETNPAGVTEMSSVGKIIPDQYVPLPGKP